MCGPSVNRELDTLCGPAGPVSINQKHPAEFLRPSPHVHPEIHIVVPGTYCPAPIDFAGNAQYALFM